MARNTFYETFDLEPPALAPCCQLCKIHPLRPPYFALLNCLWDQVQYPGAERVMMSDLRNLKTLAWFLQKFELNFDILSSLRELSRQIKNEFDFR